MILKNIHRWLDHFSMNELDSIISNLIRLKRSEADSCPQKLFYGKLTEADYHRLKLHYRIELFAGNQSKNETLNNLVSIMNDVYKRLVPTVRYGAEAMKESKTDSRQMSLDFEVKT
jgi:hypothetical protein